MKTIITHGILALLALYSLNSLAAPTISYIPVACTKTAPISISADIIDVQEIDTLSGTKPRLYFKKQSENNAYASSNNSSANGWKYVEASNSVSPFLFNFDFAKLTSPISVTDTIQYFIIAQTIDAIPAVSFNEATLSNSPASVDLQSASFPATDVRYFFRTIGTISGNITIDPTIALSDSNFHSLTKAGGLFDAINNGGLTGDINVRIRHSSSTENGAIALNQWTEYGGCAVKSVPSYTLTIRPDSANIVLAGKSDEAIIRLYGADRVVIDGRISNSSSTRNLTISNDSSIANSAAIFLKSMDTSAGSSHNSIQFVNIRCGAAQNVSDAATFGIYSNGGAIADYNTPSGAGNDYTHIEGNYIIRAKYGIALLGLDTVLSLGNSIVNNLVGPTVEGIDAIGTAGIVAANQDGIDISYNEVRFVGGDSVNIASAGDRAGIFIGTIQANLWDNKFEGGSSTTLIKNSFIKANRIHNIVEERGASAVGIAYLNKGDGGTTANQIANNMIAIVRSNGRGASGDATAAIGLVGGVDDNVSFNSINLVGDIDPAGAQAAGNPTDGLRINSTATTNPSISNLVCKNNSIAVTINSDNSSLVHHAISVKDNSSIYPISGLSYNNLYVDTMDANSAIGGVGSGSSFTDHTSLLSWRGVYGPIQNEHNICINPDYKAPADLHIAETSANINAGAGGTGIGDDIDGDPRDLNDNPAIGADEYGIGYVWYGRYSNDLANASNWKTYAAPPVLGSDTINVIIETKNIHPLLSDSFEVRNVVVKTNSILNLNDFSIRANKNVTLEGNGKILGGNNSCSNNFRDKSEGGTVRFVGAGIGYLKMDSGSVCNLGTEKDTIELKSNVTIANDILVFGSARYLNLGSNILNVQGDAFLYGVLLNDSCPALECGLLSMNGTYQQLLDVKNGNAYPGLLHNLKIDNQASDYDSKVHLAGNLSVLNKMNLSKGKLLSDRSNAISGFRYKTLTIVNSDTDAVTRVNGSSNDAFFQGKMKRKVSGVVAGYLFPVGIVDSAGKHGSADIGYYTPAIVEKQDATGDGLYLTSTFYDEDPDPANIGLTGEEAGDFSSSLEDTTIGAGKWVDVKGDYIWHVEYEASNLPYNIQMSAPFMNAGNQDELSSIPDELVMLKRSTWNSGDWEILGSHASANTHSLTPDFAKSNSVRRNGLNSFSGFGAGGNSAGGQALPVKLISLTAKSVNNEFIQVSWVTSVEINNSGFEIERSENGKDYTTIGWKDGKGNSTEKNTYTFDDKQVQKNVTYYYRLRQTDFDGAASITHTVSASIKSEVVFQWAQFVPNPAERATSLVVNTLTPTTAVVTVFTQNGLQVIDKKIELYGGVNSVPMSLDKLSAGVYIANISTPSETIQRKLVIR